MGTSKLLGERLMTAAALHQRGRGPTFFSTRFGNVLGSRGSVIPLFREQIARGGPVTLTDKSMTRFIMTLEQSVGLVLDAAPHAVGGEVFVTKMPVANIFDLAQVMIEELAPAYGHSPEEIEIRTIGPRPGEKMYEELLTEEETRRAIEVGGFIIVNPAGRPPRSELVEGCEGPMVRPYNSGAEVQLSKAELRDFLVGNGLLDLDDSYGRRKCA
jgi:FlaA1/EpsC-like NDP-sugar epimerase